MSTRIATRYGKSIFELATEKGASEAIFSDMTNLVDVCKNNSDMRDLLNSPVISIENKQKVFDALFAGFHQESRNFLSFVLSKKREAYLADMANQYIGLYNEEKGIARATVYSAIPLGDAVMNNLKRYLSSALKQGDIELDNVIDAKVIGGMVVRYKDSLLDMSVARELKELRKELIYN
jgi:F-type H+-transporting ATPase subunit delta